MVSHDITEVAYMADRIVVLGTNPGRVQTVVDNRLSRPRDYRSPGFLRLVDELHDLITGHELPDPPATADAALTTAEPLPEATASEVVGLLEYLDARGGREEIFRIAGDTRYEFGRILAIAEAAEMLDFVDTPKRLVVLAAEGKRFVQAHPGDRQAIWREALLKLRLFRLIRETLDRAPNHTVDAFSVYEMLVLWLPQENYERLFDTLVGWGRFGGLFEYDEQLRRLSLPEA